MVHAENKVPYNIMSLPSIPVIATERDINIASSTAEQQELILVEAMRRDLPEACRFLHEQAHLADKQDGAALWKQDPASPIGKQLIRMHASDAMRPLAEKHFCHGKKLTFVNCCNGVVGTPPGNVMLLQLQCQDGTIASADC